MQLELDFFEPIGYVFIVNTLDVDGPLMCVFGVDSWGTVVWVDRFGDTAED